jgi:antitoxin component of RelBE/YafQ-DinJ toxin-antitoxin module
MNRSLLLPGTYAELERWAQKISKTDMVPKAYKGRPDDIIVAVQYGSEIGLGFLESLKSIAVINGNPSVFGDGLLAICQRSPDFEDLIEEPEISSETGETLAFVATACRKNRTPKMKRFSQTDAKRAGLWGKAGPWTQYPDRMLQMRARGFALRDQFADALKGIISAEEAADYPTIDGQGEEKIGRAQLLEAEDLLVRAGMDSNTLLNTMLTGVTKLEDIPIKDWPRIKNALTMRAQRRQAPVNGDEKS